MCRRLLSLWHAPYGYKGRIAGRDKGQIGRLMLIVETDDVISLS